MTRRLRIALVAPLWLPVPPRTYGGTEMIVELLLRHYGEAGHEVVLYATGDSDPAGHQLRSVAPDGLVARMAASEAATYEHYVNALAAEVVEASSGFDVIHSHLGMAQLPILSLASCPVVHTVHARLDVDDCWIATRCSGVTLVTLTRAHAEPLTRGVHVVHSGIDLARYPPTPRTGDHLVFLGRMSPAKNPLGAIAVAAAAGRRLVLAGAPQNRDEKQYFRERVEPQIDGERVCYVGAVDHPAKVRLLGDAAAMLFPIDWAEPFGLVMVEAMACGTPVVASRRASVTEVVEPGVTGFYADDLDALAALVDPATELDRGEVRARAEQRFSFRTMGDRYLSILGNLT